MRKGIGFYVGRVATYFFLSLFALIMIFPFLYMMSTSLKTSNDVFHVPPRLLPYSPEQREVDGKLQSVYLFNLNGVNTEMYATSEREQFGFFSLPAEVIVQTPRDSRVEVQLPLSELTPSGKTLTLKGTDDKSVDFDLYTVTAPTAKSWSCRWPIVGRSISLSRSTTRP